MTIYDHIMAWFVGVCIGYAVVECLLRRFGGKQAICRECGVYFEPTHGESLCQPHRDKVLSLERRKSAVAAWANINFERLEKQMQEERVKEVDGLNRLYQGNSREIHSGLDQVGKRTSP